MREFADDNGILQLKDLLLDRASYNVCMYICVYLVCLHVPIYVLCIKTHLHIYTGPVTYFSNTMSS